MISFCQGSDGLPGVNFEKGPMLDGDFHEMLGYFIQRSAFVSCLEGKETSLRNEVCVWEEINRGMVKSKMSENLVLTQLVMMVESEKRDYLDAVEEIARMALKGDAQVSLYYAENK